MASNTIAPTFDMRPAMQELCEMHGSCPIYRINSHSSNALSSSSSFHPFSNNSSKDATDPLLFSLNQGNVTREGYKKLVGRLKQLSLDDQISAKDKETLLSAALKEAQKHNRGYSWLNRQLTADSPQARKIKAAYERFIQSPKAAAFGDPYHLLEPSDLDPLLERLDHILNENTLPAAYRKDLVKPFKRILECYRLYRPDFLNKQLDERALLANGKECPIANVARSILQNFDTELSDKNRETARSTQAAAEVIRNIFQTFLTDQCTKGPQSHCLTLSSPLPNWSPGGLSTYSRPMPEFGSFVSIVNLPITYAKQSALAWGCIGHEVAGHDVLAVHPGALNELEQLIFKKLKDNKLENTAPKWKEWLEETASDVLNVLNTGPAAAFSIIAMLRALRANDYHFKLNPTHSCWKNSSGDVKCDVHPIDLIRGYIALHALEELHGKTQFDPNGIYAEAIRKEVKWDAAERKLEASVENTQATLAQFEASAGIVVRVIMNSKLQALGGLSFSEIRAWGEEDEEKVKTLRKNYYSDSGAWGVLAKSLKERSSSGAPTEGVKEIEQRLWKLAAELLNGRSAPHVVSAAVFESICPTPNNPLDKERLQTIFRRVIFFLEILHSKTRQLQADSPHSFSNSSGDEYEYKE